MDLYTALQGILNKINDAAVEGRYQDSEREMLKAVLENQTRLAEALLVMGGLLKGIIDQDVEVQVFPGKKDAKH